MAGERQRISGATGFDHGERFGSEEQVREYFTVANMVAMFGAEDGATVSQADLDEMADAVIRNRWHWRHLTTTEAAAATSTSRVLWRNLAAAGRIPGASKHGRDWLIPAGFVAGYERGAGGRSRTQHPRA